MATAIKALVSKRKRRFKEDGFNLDLTYIYDNVIAMGFPATKLEGVYRNHIDDVVRFLETKHKDHYKIYNLCSERSYDPRTFHERVSTFGFDDHNPPRLDLIKPFCEDVDQWLNQDPQNVAVVHCKAGKGRTGVMICCYIVHRGWCESSDEALSHYGQTRTHDRKGVTIPSQRRYVEYYDHLLRNKLDYSLTPRVLHEIHMEPVPNYTSGCNPVIEIWEAETQTKMVPGVEVKKGDGYLRLMLKPPITLRGDIRVTFYNKPNKVLLKDKMFQCWFNTFFVRQEMTSLMPSPFLTPKMKCNILSTSTVTGSSGVSVSFARLSAADRNERAGSCPAPDISFLTLSGTRTSSYGSLTSNSTIPSASRWLVLTLTKQELDRACKDTGHRIFTADFKVSMYFTNPCPVNNNGATSAPFLQGIPSEAHLKLNPSKEGPSMSNGRVTERSNGSPATRAASLKVAPNPPPGGKQNPPKSLGLLGPICWRNQTQKTPDVQVADVLDSCLPDEPRRTSSSSHWSSESNESLADSDPLEEALSYANDHPDEEGTPCPSECVTVGRYCLLSYSASSEGGTTSGQQST